MYQRMVLRPGPQRRTGCRSVGRPPGDCPLFICHHTCRSTITTAEDNDAFGDIGERRTWARAGSGKWTRRRRKGRSGHQQHYSSGKQGSISIRRRRRQRATKTRPGRQGPVCSTGSTSDAVGGPWRRRVVVPVSLGVFRDPVPRARRSGGRGAEGSASESFRLQIDVMCAHVELIS